MVTVTSSSLMSDSQPLSSLCGRLSTRCVTKPHQKSWIQINNNPMQFPIPIVPLNNMSAPQQNMQLNANANNNWRLQGSLDGEQCTVIRKHQNDESLRFKGQSYSWLLRNINSYYTQFRIFQFDKNSSNHYYLACSGFEIYGQVLRQNHNIQWDEWPRNKSKHLQVNRIKNSVVNIGSDDTWQSV